jgi:hypothetical protein
MKHRSRYFLAAAVSLATLLVYWSSLKNAFVWDDEQYVVNNTAIRSFDPAFFRWAFLD